MIRPQNLATVTCHVGKGENVNAHTLNCAPSTKELMVVHGGVQNQVVSIGCDASAEHICWNATLR